MQGSWRGGSLDSASSCSSSILSILTADGNDDDEEEQQHETKTKHEKVSMSVAPPSHPIEGVAATAGSRSAGGSSSALGGLVRKRISFCEGDPTTMGAGTEAAATTTAGPAPTASPSQRGPPPPPCPFGHELRKGMAGT